MASFETESVLIPSESAPRNYVVSRFEDGTYVCQCSGFKFRGYCKHIRQVSETDAAQAHARTALYRLRDQGRKLSELAESLTVDRLEKADSLYDQVEVIERVINQLKGLRRA